MIITTTNNIDNLQIDQYLGIIYGNVVIGNNSYAEYTTTCTDILEGGARACKGNLGQTYRNLNIELESEAKEMGADAIVGIRYDFKEIVENGMPILLATATGTAVKVSRDRFFLYEKLHALKTFLKDGILNEEEYEYEKKRLVREYDNPISDEIKAIQRHESQMKKEYADALRQYTERIEKEKIEEQKRLEQAAEEERQCAEMAEKIKANESLIRSILVSDVLAADGSVINDNGSLGDAAKEAIISGKVAEFCKFYMETTGLDASDAIEYIQSLYDLMQK